MNIALKKCVIFPPSMYVHTFTINFYSDSVHIQANIRVLYVYY